MSVEKTIKIIEHLEDLARWYIDPLDENKCVIPEILEVFGLDLSKTIDLDGYKRYSGDPDYPVNGPGEFSKNPDTNKWACSPLGRRRRDFCQWLACEMKRLNAFAIGMYVAENPKVTLSFEMLKHTDYKEGLNYVAGAD